MEHIRSSKLSLKVALMALAVMMAVCLVPALARADEATSEAELSPMAGTDAAIKLTDKVTGDPIAGVNFNFAKVDLLGGTPTPIGSAKTDAKGIASVGVTETGKYTATYAKDGSLPSTYDATALDLDWEITVTEDNTPGVQLVEDWTLDTTDGLGGSKVKFRDVVSDGSLVTVSGQLKADLTIPSESTYDGVPITLSVAEGDGIVMQVDSNTGKVIWATNFPSGGGAVYSLTSLSNGGYAAVTYGKQEIKLLNADGNITGTINIAGTNHKFDIASTSDGNLLVADYSYPPSQIYEYKLDGTLVNTIDLPSASTAGGTGAKSVIEASDGQIVAAGGGDNAVAWVGKYKKDDSSVSWLFSITGHGGTSRFNDVIETVEDGQTYYVTAGYITETSGTITIPADQTASGEAMTLSSSTSTNTAIIVKLNSEGKVVWAQTVSGQNATGGEQEFNSVTAETDGTGAVTGYSTAGQVAGQAIIGATKNILGQDVAINTTSTTSSDAIIARFTTDGLYVDSYLYGSNQGGDQYYGIDSADRKIWAVGNDATNSVVQLSTTLTAVPTPVAVPQAQKFEVTTAVTDSRGGTISGLGWTPYEVVENGAKVTKDYIATPEAGWYLEEVMINGAVVAQPYTTSAYTITPDTIGAIYKDTEVRVYYAKGTVPNYTVTFDSQSGSAVAPQTVAGGKLATEPTAPTRDGYTFDGWYEDAACTIYNNWNTPVTADITLYAKWTAIPEYTVTFDSQGGSAVDPQTVQSGDVATEPTAPTRDGYTFGGWYTDSACTTAYDFATPVTSDITLYASWTANAPAVSPETPTVTPTSSTPSTTQAVPKTGDNNLGLLGIVGIALAGGACLIVSKRLSQRD